MQFSRAFVASLFAVAAQAGPAIQTGPSASGSHDTRAINVAENMVSINLCSTIVKCVAALAPTVIACVAAAAEEGLNPIADAACIAAAANTGLNPPTSCSGCF